VATPELGDNLYWQECVRVVGRIVGIPEISGFFVTREFIWNGVNMILIAHCNTSVLMESYRALKLAGQQFDVFE
jgi:hypothetical protein